MRSITPASGIAQLEYLGSTVGNRFKSGTIAASTVSTEDGAGKKYLQKGVLLAKINSPAAVSGMYGPYSSAASDGRQLDHNIGGFNDTFSDLSEGNKEVGILYGGTVIASKVDVGDGLGNVAEQVRTKLRTARLDILFRD